MGADVVASSGFTLVEIMIVIAVAAVVFAIGVPAFARIVQKDPMRQAVSDVVEALGQARAQAILRGVPVEFVLNSEGQMRVLPARERREESEGRRSDRAWDEPEPSVPATIFAAHLGEDIMVSLLELNFRSQMDADEVRVRFFPNGTCDDFTIVLEEGGQIRRVWLDPITSLADLETLR